MTPTELDDLRVTLERFKTDLLNRAELPPKPYQFIVTPRQLAELRQRYLDKEIEWDPDLHFVTWDLHRKG